MYSLVLKDIAQQINCPKSINLREPVNLNNNLSQKVGKPVCLPIFAQKLKQVKPL